MWLLSNDEYHGFEVTYDMCKHRDDTAHPQNVSTGQLQQCYNRPDANLDDDPPLLLFAQSSQSIQGLL